MRWYWYVGIIVVVVLATPLPSTIQVKHELGPQHAQVNVSTFGLTMYSAVTANTTLYLPRGFYTITVEQEGFHTEQRFMTSWRPDTYTFTLEPKEVSLRRDFVDPTRSLHLDPRLHVTGVDVLGRHIAQNVSQRANVTYGTYQIDASTVHFEQTFTLDGYELSPEPVLDANDKFYTVSNETVTHVYNYVRDYVNFSRNDLLELSGLPRRYPLANHTLSLGDMTFLLCQAAAYESRPGQYFVPRDKLYTTTRNALDVEDCYEHALYGYVPERVSRVALARLVGNASYVPRQSWLNHDDRVGNVSFTFDIESGRYVNEENKERASINPCSPAVTGVPPRHRRYCDDADRIAWFTPVLNDSDTSVPYPWRSGTRGLDTILSWTERYGIPTTQYVVAKELPVYDRYTNVMSRLRNVSDRVEVGYHSRYHSHLARVPQEWTEQEFRVVKPELERRFGVNVSGHRGPYLSLIQGDVDVHEDMLARFNFSYYSRVPGRDGEELRHVPYTRLHLAEQNMTSFDESMDRYGYVMTLDHPWDLYYTTEVVNGTTYLVYNASRSAEASATVLDALSAGYVPVTARELMG